MHGLRAELGIVPVRMEQMGPSVVRTLREGGILALLIDRPVARGGVPVRLFGADTAIPRGPAALALMTGAKVVPVAFVRSKPNRAPVRLLADFSIETPAERTREAERRLTQRIVEAHEGFVRECPEQWYMFRRFWPEQEGAALTPVPSPDFAGEGRLEP
jgi:KDO2-lipid IV(A) lauroyltransferase